jgi:hypothetical protein
MTSHYKASLDLPAKIITGLFHILCLFFALKGMLLPALLLFVTDVVCYFLHPTGYELNKAELLIKRPFKPVVIKRTDIAEIVFLTDEQLKWTIRSFGVGGLFGYFGYFYNRQLGSMLWYTSQRKNRILIRLKNEEKIVISPDDPSLFEYLKWQDQTGFSEEE